MFLIRYDITMQTEFPLNLYRCSIRVFFVNGKEMEMVYYLEENIQQGHFAYVHLAFLLTFMT